MRGWNFSA